MKKLCFYLCIIIIYSFLFSEKSIADDTHFNSTLVGERASGMGGTFTAISNNAAGLYYNPAGITEAPPNIISSSVQLVQAIHKQYDGFYSDQKFVRGAFGITGVYTGYIKSLSHGKIGFSIAIPDSIKEEIDHRWDHEEGWEHPASPDYFGDKHFSSESLLEFDYEFSVYNFGPSYAIPLTRNLSIGMTLYAHLKKTRQINIIIKRATNTKIQGENTISYFNNHMYNYSRSVSESGVRPIIGLMYRTSNRKFSFGLTYSQVFVLSSEDKYREFSSLYRYAEIDGKQYNDPDWIGSSEFHHYEDAIETRRNYPFNLRTGVSYTLTEKCLMAMDISYFEKSKRRIFSKAEERKYNNSSVLNASIGTEYRLNDKYYVRSGLFTDFSNTPSNDEELHLLETEHIDLYGLSFSVSRKSNELSYITIGTSFRFGKGKATIKEDPVPVLDVTQTVFNLFLSASF